jgi:hypothetical protein
MSKFIGGMIAGAALLALAYEFFGPGHQAVLGYYNSLQLPAPNSSPTTSTPTAAAPPAERCKVEDWRYRADRIGSVWIEGTTTCPSGYVTIRAYDGDGKFLGTMSDHFRGYTFRNYFEGTAPKEMKIRYTIEPMQLR